MFTLLGITGNTGGSAARALLAQGHRVRALVRDPARAAEWAARGVELVAGEVTDEAALRRAFAGARAAYGLVPPNPSEADPIRQYLRTADAVRVAARAEGLPRLVFLSSEGAQHARGTGPIRGSHVAEAVLADAAPEVAFLRPSYFQENWLPAFAAARAQGIWPSFFAEGAAPRSMVAARDIGAEAARLLAQEGAPPPVVELSSAALYTDADAARAAGAALGREISVVRPPRAAWEGILAGAGAGPALAALVAEMYDGINTGHVGFSGTAERRQGSTPLAETIAAWA